MPTPGFQAFDLTVTVQLGPIPGFDIRVALVIAARAVVLDATLAAAFPGHVRGHVTVLADASRFEKALDSPAAHRLHDAVARTLAQPLRIDGVVDTSDTGTQVVAQGSVDDQPFRVAFGAMSSGYRGPDAPAFAACMRELLEAAGVSGDGPWRDLLMARS